MLGTAHVGFLGSPFQSMAVMVGTSADWTTWVLHLCFEHFFVDGFSADTASLVEKARALPWTSRGAPLQLALAKAMVQRKVVRRAKRKAKKKDGCFLWTSNPFLAKILDSLTASSLLYHCFCVTQNSGVDVFVTCPLCNLRCTAYIVQHGDATHGRESCRKGYKLPDIVYDNKSLTGRMKVDYKPDPTVASWGPNQIAILRTQYNIEVLVSKGEVDHVPAPVDRLSLMSGRLDALKEDMKIQKPTPIQMQAETSANGCFLQRLVPN